jgi:co-chaperonin GroES (HSP10)
LEIRSSFRLSKPKAKPPLVSTCPTQPRRSPRRARSSVGDRVLFSKYGGNEVTIDGEDFMILDEDQIYAVLN